jgi:hypothetical protein
VIRGAQANDAGYFLRTLRKTNHVGCLQRMPGFAASVLLEDRLAGADAITEQAAQLFDWRFGSGNTGSWSTHVHHYSIEFRP